MTDNRILRECLGSFPTGVTIVTTRSAEGRPVGLTANSFSSVSLDPPLVLWCLARLSDSFAHFEHTRRFAINVLGAGQQDIAERFASQVIDRFQSIEWDSGDKGLPLIGGAVATLECHTHAMHDGGDHLIIVGEVTGLAANGGQPLVFLRGQYTAAPD